jgi:hypothetical protein
VMRAHPFSAAGPRRLHDSESLETDLTVLRRSVPGSGATPEREYILKHVLLQRRFSRHAPRSRQAACTCVAGCSRALSRPARRLAHYAQGGAGQGARVPRGGRLGSGRWARRSRAGASRSGATSRPASATGRGGFTSPRSAALGQRACTPRRHGWRP